MKRSNGTHVTSVIWSASQVLRRSWNNGVSFASCTRFEHDSSDAPNGYLLEVLSVFREGATRPSGSRPSTS